MEIPGEAENMSAPSADKISGGRRYADKFAGLRVHFVNMKE